MKSRSILWIIGYFLIVAAALLFVMSQVITVDPFFHYHKPYTDSYYYKIDNERSQNDGIIRNFDYDAIISGSSMTENFKTSEMDLIFGTNSIKVPFSGGTFKEINDNLVNGLKTHPDVKVVVRGVDMSKFLDDKDAMRQDLGEFPTYLYDDNYLNDVKYVFNRDVVYKRVYPMLKEKHSDEYEPGITSFDEYSYWMDKYSFGINSVYEEEVLETEYDGTSKHLSDEEKERVMDNTRENLTAIADAYPDTTFYYFFPPYSIAWWQKRTNDDLLTKQFEAEQLIVEEILQHDNIRLYSFNNLTDITTDLNNYKDRLHYGSWINSLMLQYMHDGVCQITPDNYVEYFDREIAFYSSFDYASLEGQEDYENDYYAEALLLKEINGTEPMILDTAGLQKDDSGVSIEIDDITPYTYLVFDGIKNKTKGAPNVTISGGDQTVLEFSAEYKDINTKTHQYLLDVSGLSGPVVLYLNDGTVDETDEQALFYYSNIVLY